MPTITFHLEAQLRRLAGGSTVSLDIDQETTLAQALQLLAKRSPDVANYLVTEDGSISRSLLIAVDEENISATEAAHRQLERDSTVVLLPPISGG